MKKYIYGVDLGGTTIKIGFFSIEGELKDNFEINTNTENSGQNILYEIGLAIKEHMEKNSICHEEVHGIGIGVPGPVSNGTVYHCVNLGWGIVNVKAELEALTNIRVAVGNDANVAGLGELWKGGGSGYSNMVFITLGTGVGGAVIVNNQIVDGNVGAGGEIGHAPTLDNEFLCNCGKVGCLETVASATGVVRVAKKILSETNTPSSLRDLKVITAKDVFDQAKLNDQVALDVIDVFGKNLGFMCGFIGIVTNPQVFIFGGGVSKAGDIIIDIIKKHFKNYAFPRVVDNTEFRLAELGNNAGIYGAAYLAKNIGGL